MSDVIYAEKVAPQDTNTPRMRHICSFVTDKALCGFPLNPKKPASFGPVDCVVCHDIYYNVMTRDEANRLCEFWGG